LNNIWYMNYMNLSWPTDRALTNWLCFFTLQLYTLLKNGIDSKAINDKDWNIVVSSEVSA